MAAPGQRRQRGGLAHPLQALDCRARPPTSCPGRTRPKTSSRQRRGDRHPASPSASAIGQPVLPADALGDAGPPLHDVAGAVHAEHADEPPAPAVEGDEPALLDRAVTTRTRRRGRTARPAGSCGRTGRTRTTAPARSGSPGPSPASSRRAAWAPWSRAFSQCSTRMTSPKRAFGQRAMSPAATTPGAARQVSSHTTPLSRASPEPSSQPVVGAHADADDDDVGVDDRAVGQPHPLDPVAALEGLDRRRRGGRRPRGPGAGRRTASPARCPRTRSSGTGRASTTVTSWPRWRQVAATSEPMKPAPTTTTRPGEASRSARRARQSSSVRRMWTPARSVRCPAGAAARHRWR